MARITPDSYTKIHIVDSIASESAPTVAELAAGTEVTGFLTPAGLDTPEEGTDAGTSSIASARDFAVPATIGGELSGEFYRDNSSDDAWDALARLTETHLLVGRFGGTGTDSRSLTYFDIRQNHAICSNNSKFSDNNLAYLE